MSILNAAVCVITYLQSFNYFEFVRIAHYSVCQTAFVKPSVVFSFGWSVPFQCKVVTVGSFDAL